MISTKDYSSLISGPALQKNCKAIAVLDAILSPDWEYRYYTYNARWGAGEELFEMRDGEGDELLLLFCEAGNVINGFAHEMDEADKDKLTEGLPQGFHEFIFGEPVNSIGTSFCLWNTDQQSWKTGILGTEEDGSDELLFILDGKPETYIKWASEYFEGEFTKSGIPLDVVSRLYKGDTLTKEMVLAIVDELEDWEQLEADLSEIDYPYEFSE